MPAGAALKDLDSAPYAPAAPRTMEETGLPFSFVAQLACKIFFHAGPQRLGELAGRIGLPPLVLEPVLDFLRRERQCEVSSQSTGTSSLLMLTAAGRERAEEALRSCSYAGPAPITLQAYVAQVGRQSIRGLAVTRRDIQRAFAGVVVHAEILDQLGAAMNSGRALFLYGQAGAGKTFLAERLADALSGDVFIPYAVLAGTQVIQLFDPYSHRLSDAGSAEPRAFRLRESDSRWALCRRPVVIAGGELTLAMLDLQFDATARFYAAPIQLKANNGLLIIDDLGRQHVRPADLMNRWTAALDRGVDYLTLHTGEKYLVPFDLTVAFSTNLSPGQLGDEAFLRRLGYKIRLGALDEIQYREICRQVCAANGIACSERSFDYLIERFRTEGRPLLACTPRDLLEQVRARARYTGAAVELNDALLAWAWNNYFFQGGAPAQPAQEPTP
jgi:hypothetical protein